MHKDERNDRVRNFCPQVRLSSDKNTVHSTVFFRTSTLSVQVYNFFRTKYCPSKQPTFFRTKKKYSSRCPRLRSHGRTHLLPELFFSPVWAIFPIKFYKTILCRNDSQWLIIPTKSDGRIFFFHLPCIPEQFRFGSLYHFTCNSVTFVKRLNNITWLNVEIFFYRCCPRWCACGLYRDCSAK